jgi:hypothetical protein
MRWWLFLFLFVAVVFPAIVPFIAIGGNKGIPVYMNIEKTNQSGIWLNVYNTVIDETLVESIRSAYSLTHPKGVRISFFDSYLSGPSGGLMFYLYFKFNATDVLASGEIYGSEVLPVGAEYEKALEAKKLGYKRFITAPGSLLDYYLLKHLEDSDFKVLFVKNVKQADDAYLNNRSFFPSWLFQTPPLIEENCPYNTSWLLPVYDYFKSQLLNATGDSILDEYYRNYTNATDQILSHHCYYTAANFLFLKLAEKRAMFDVINNVSLEGRKSEVLDCLEDYLNPGDDISVGAALRMRWAYRSLRDVETNATLVGDKFNAFFDIEEAALWCQTAKLLYREGNFSFNQETLREMLLSQDTNDEYYNDAVWFYLKGCFVCSAYSLAYVSDNNTEFLSNYTSLWAQAYASQAYYLEKTSGDKERVLAIANNLEKIYRLSKIEAFNNVDPNTILFVGGVISGFGLYYLLRKAKEALLQSSSKAKSRRYKYSGNRRAAKKNN